MLNSCIQRGTASVEELDKGLAVGVGVGATISVVQGKGQH